MLHRGSCHCGAVAFEVETDLEQVLACNCSHCSRKGYLLTFVPRSALVVLQGEEALSTYRFNTHTIAHRFCATCGCARSARERNETGAINVRCLETVDLDTLTPVRVDGRSF